MRWMWLAWGAMACGGGDSEGTDPGTDADTGEPVATVDSSTPVDSGTDTGTAPMRTAEELATWGAFSVGTDELDIDGPEGLTLTAQIWYPSAAPQGDGETYDNVLAGYATEGLPSDCSDIRPVLVFSHGNGGVRWQSPFFTEHLASHGYVVIAIDHLYNTLFDLDLSKLDELAIRRPADVEAAFDALPGIPAVADCVDPSAGYAVAGHSFGGYTALAVAGAEVNDPTAGGAPVFLDDPRVWATIGLAPWDGFGAITDGTHFIEVPTLILTGRRDATTPILQVRGLWSPLTVEPRYLGIFERAGHYSFSPAACILETSDGCAPDDIPIDEFTPMVNQASLAFLESVRVDPAYIDLRPEASAELTWE